MAWTKGAIVQDAFAEIAIAGHIFDLDPDEIALSLRTLDLMMATWQSQGIRLGYNISATPDGSAETQDSGLPLEAVEAVKLGLAIRLAAGKGKSLAPSTTRTAKAAYDALMSRAASQQVREQQWPSGVPYGAGNSRYRPLTPEPNTGPLNTDTAGNLDFQAIGS